MKKFFSTMWGVIANPDDIGIVLAFLIFVVTLLVIVLVLIGPMFFVYAVPTLAVVRLIYAGITGK